MINRVIIVGHLGQNPEIRTVGSTSKVATFSVATSETWKDTSGNRMEHTEWHNVQAWNAMADIVARFASKGSQVYVEGKIRTRSYEKDGQKKYITEIIADEFRLLGHAPKPTES